MVWVLYDPITTIVQSISSVQPSLIPDGQAMASMREDTDRDWRTKAVNPTQYMFQNGQFVDLPSYMRSSSYSPVKSASTNAVARSTNNKWVPAFRRVNLNGNNFSKGDSNHQAVTYKVRHYCTMKTGNLRLQYANWLTTDADGANGFTIQSAIQDSSGNQYPVYFNGKSTYTMDVGETVLSDPVSIFCNPGDTIYTLNYVSVQYVKPVLSTATTGGSLPAATYYVTFSWTDANGKTQMSAEASIATTGSTSTITVKMPASIPNATVYISTSSGTETQQGTTTTGTYTQSAALVAGAAMPGSINTAQTYPLGLPIDGRYTDEGIAQGNGITSSLTYAQTEPDNSALFMWMPINIFGIADSTRANPYEVCAFFGDSIVYGWGGNSVAGWNGEGFPQYMAQTAGRGVIMAGNPGEKVMPTGATSYKHRYQLAAQYATYCIVQYGGNDFPSRTVAQEKGYITTLGQNLKSMGIKKIYLATVIPYTNTSNVPYTGYEGGSNSERSQLNAWIRTCPAPWDGYIDITTAVETGFETGQWITSMTSDYDHPNPAGHQAIAAMCNLNDLFAGKFDVDHTNTSVVAGFFVTPSNNMLELSWDASTDPNVTGYNVYLNGVQHNVSLVTSTNYTLAGLTNGKEYSVYVTTMNGWYNESGPSTAINAIPENPSSIINDTFTRANNTSTLGNAESGTSSELTWHVLTVPSSATTCTFGVNNDQMVLTAGAGIAMVNAGKANVNMQVTASAFVGSWRIAFRATSDGLNYLEVTTDNKGHYCLQEYSNGADGTIIADSAFTPANGDVIQINGNGDLVTVYVNNIQILQANNSFDDTDTYFGIWSNNVGAAWDNFRVWP